MQVSYNALQFNCRVESPQPADPVTFEHPENVNYPTGIKYVIGG